MRRIVSVVFMFVFLSIALWANESTNHWLDDFDVALALSKSKNLPILINFTGSDWCIWCHRLRDEVLSHKEFLDFATSKFVLFVADYPRDINQSQKLKEQNNSLAKKFDIKGYPTILIIDSNQKVIGQTGYRDGGVDSYISHLSDFLKK